MFLSRLVRILFVLLLVRLVLRAVASALRPRPAAAPPRSPAAPDRELVRDRVCNTFLPRERALTAFIAGRQEHFCSAACRDRALLAVSRAS